MQPVLSFSALMFLVLLPVATGATPIAGEPQPGQIVVDPEHPLWLKRQGGEHVFICGPGDPEDFLYRGTRRPDGTRDGDQVELIQKLIRYGGNSIYMQVVRSHGGDGGPDHNPFVESDPARGLSDPILSQWEEWFSLMDSHDILIYLFLYDDGARIWGRKGQKDPLVPPEERAFIEAIVRRFRHHKNLIWLVAEESEEASSDARVREIARIIQQADPFGHLIGNHHTSMTRFRAWQPGSALNHFAMQFTAAGHAAHLGAIEALRRASGKYQIIYAESTAAEPDIWHAWRSAMGGLMPMMLSMDIASTSPETLAQCRILQRFFEGTDFYRMGPQDHLGFAGTRYLLADPGRSAIAYAEEDRGPLGIGGLSAGKYALTWLDCQTGHTVQQGPVELRGGDHTFPRPEGIGGQCALWVRRIDPSEPRFPGETWDVRTPEEVGLQSEALEKLAQAVGGDGVVIRRGSLVYAWGDPTRRGDWASAMKPVISTLLLMAVQEGKLGTVTDLVRPWVQRRWPGKDLSEKGRNMTFLDLANMTSGYARAEPPGSHWAYNDYAISLYRHVMEEVLGASLNEAALARLRDLQFEDGDLFGSRGGAGIDTSPRDFARIGWFWLNRGRWRDHQILPAWMFHLYCAPLVPPDLPRTAAAGEDTLDVGTIGGGSDQDYPGQGIYGLNWWFNAPMPGTDERFVPHLPRDAFFAIGHRGKEVLILIPSLEMVVAGRGDWGGLRLPHSRWLMEALEENRGERSAE